MIFFSDGLLIAQSSGVLGGVERHLNVAQSVGLFIEATQLSLQE